MNEWHIAQINVSRPLYPLDDPRLSDFVSRLEDINGLAEKSPGFVWRLKSGGEGELIEVAEDPDLVINMTVWENIEALFEFAYRSAHQPVMARRRDWFERPKEANQVMWWIPAGHVPTLEEGLEKLTHIRQHDPKPEAFNFKTKFAAPDAFDDGDDLAPDYYCAGGD